MVVVFAGWYIMCGNTYKVKDLELTSENVALIQKTFLNFKLPGNSKIEKASRISGNGSSMFVKLTIPQDNIEEFNSSYQDEEHLPITESDYKIYNINKKSIKWWVIDKDKADYMIMPGGSSFASMQFIYLKPSNGLVTVYMKQ